MMAQQIDWDEFNPLEIKLFHLLQRKGPISRPDIVKLLGNPRTTIHDNLNRLIDRDLVRKFSRSANQRGRPLVYFKLTTKGEQVA